MSPKYLEFSGNILSAGQRILVSVADVLTMAQLEAGSFVLRPEVLELGEVVRGFLAAFRRANSSLARELRFAAPSTGMPVYADERAIAEMMGKLLSNAVKFSDPGSPITVRLDLLASGHYRLGIADEGIGMTAEQVEIAVQPFSQVDSSLAGEFEGIGLGLSITKGLIEAHRGRLKITSAPMTGTQVELHFPVPDENCDLQPYLGAGTSLAA